MNTRANAPEKVAPPLRCKFHFHKWSVWGKIYMIPDAVFAVKFQDRECLLCHKVDTRTSR